MNKALYEYAMNFRGQEQKVIEYYKNNQDAMTQLQAPIYENKILDFMLDKVKLKSTDINVDSFIKLYNGVNAEKSELNKKKTARTIVNKIIIISSIINLEPKSLKVFSFIYIP